MAKKKSARKAEATEPTPDAATEPTSDEPIASEQPDASGTDAPVDASGGTSTNPSVEEGIAATAEFNEQRQAEAPEERTSERAERRMQREERRAARADRASNPAPVPVTWPVEYANPDISIPPAAPKSADPNDELPGPTEAIASSETRNESSTASSSDTP